MILILLKILIGGKKMQGSPECIVESMRSPVVETPVNGSNIYPSIETLWLPDLLPLALILKTQTKIPIRPRDTRGITQRRVF